MICSARLAAANVITVDSTSDPGNPQSCTLSDAIAAANTDAAVNGCAAGSGSDTITFSSVLALPATTRLTAEIASDVTINGPGAASLAIRVGNWSISDGGQLVLSGFTIEGGYWSGGIVNLEGGTVVLTDCILSRNFASESQGGGLHNAGTAILTNSTFSANSTVYGGGGMYNTGTATVTNCTFSGNSDAGHTGGGGIYNAGTLAVTNSTFRGNSANAPGGGIYNSGALTITITIIADSSSGGDCDGTGLVTDGGNNLIEDAAHACGLTNGVNGNIAGVDPMLDPDGLQDNGGPTKTIALLDESPAIDAGDPEVCGKPPVGGLDQRGYVRPGPGSTNCSIGAYEHGYPVPSRPSATPTATVTPTWTNMPTPSPTTPPPSGDGGDGGCTMTPTPGSGAVWWAFLPVWLLGGPCRRRTRRAAHTES